MVACRSAARLFIGSDEPRAAGGAEVSTTRRRFLGLIGAAATAGPAIVAALAKDPEVTFPYRRPLPVAQLPNGATITDLTYKGQPVYALPVETWGTAGVYQPDGGIYPKGRGVVYITRYFLEHGGRG